MHPSKMSAVTSTEFAFACSRELQIWCGTNVVIIEHAEGMFDVQLGKKAEKRFFLL
jgi:hypothetical protein